MPAGLPPRLPGWEERLATEVGNQACALGSTRGKEPWLPPRVGHTSGILCGPPTCAHTRTHTHTMGHSVPPLPSPPLAALLPLPSGPGLEHWVPEPGLGSLRPGPPGAATGHTACTSHARPPGSSLATAMGTRVSYDYKTALGLLEAEVTR